MIRRRLLKYFLVGLTTLGLGAYWAFSTFLFNPLEGDYEYDLSTLIPREIDFYASKSGLRSDFEPLPRLAFITALEESESGQALLETELVADLLARLDVGGPIAQLEAQLAELPVRTDPLQIFGGEDLAVAGTLRGPNLELADWAIYGRASWLGKLGLEVVRSGLVDLSAQGLTLTELPAGFTLSGGTLTRPLHVTRVLDVIVVATTPELVAKAHELDDGRGENSFGLSAKYADSIASLSKEGNELEAYIDYRALAENLRLTGSWPNPAAPEFPEALAGRLFQIGSVRELMTSIAFGNGLTFNLKGQLSSEYMNPLQKRLYRRQGLDKAEVLELASMVPEDCGLFASGRLPIGDILREASTVVDEAVITNLEDLVRSVWGHPDLGPLISDLDMAFKDRFAFFLRANDYPADESDSAPLVDGTPVPAWALVLVIDQHETVDAIRQHIVSNQPVFGIRGREPGTRGVFENTVAGGGRIFEYHNPLVPGTGHLATLEMAAKGGGTYFVLSNSHQMLGEVFVTYRRGQDAGLAEENWFQTLVNTGLGSSDLTLWLNPRAVSETARALAAYAAELDVALAIDWRVERPRLEQEVLREHFPGHSKRTLDPESLDSFELMVDRAADDLQVDALPALKREYVRRIDVWEITSRTLLQLAIDQKRFHLYGRIVVPFD